MEWLNLGRGAGVVLWKSLRFLRDAGPPFSTDSLLLVFANGHPRLGHDQSYFDPSLRSNFEGVLTQSLPSGDTWDTPTREVYEKTLSYIGSSESLIPGSLVAGDFPHPRTLPRANSLTRPCPTEKSPEGHKKSVHFVRGLVC